jgi:Flp pilus assembly protein TadD
MHPNSISSQSLGEQALAQNRFEEAERQFRLALADRPDAVEAMRGLGYALFQLNRLPEALVCLEDVVQRAPGDLLGRMLFGRLCLRLGEPAAAEKQFQRILKKIPNSEPALSGLVDAAIARNSLQEAEKLAKRIVAFNPKSEVGNIAVANVAEMLGKYAEAQATYDYLVRLHPGDVHHRYNRSRSLLRHKRFSEGLTDYECRFAVGKIKTPSLPSPRWQGEKLEHLLLVVEQGLGDTLLFSRFIHQAGVIANRITLACQPSLKSLLARSFNVETIDIESAAWPPHDAHLPLMSLPFVLQLGNSTIQPVGKYITADSGYLARWAEKLSLSQKTLHVGVVYTCSIAHHTEQFPQTRRSCPVEELHSLECQGVRYFSLQQGEEPDAALPEGWMGLGGQIESFEDTAAIIQLLDLVVSVDTATVHLAGALSKPAALLLPFSGDWRWFDNQDASDWYPSVKVFRQSRPGSWHEPMLEIRKWVSDLVSCLS